jgi:hypothetical protein
MSMLRGWGDKDGPTKATEEWSEEMREEKPASVVFWKSNEDVFTMNYEHKGITMAGKEELRHIRPL